ncbi:MAG: hypothetical protein ACPHO8_14490 [Mariniblastus sp.]
MFKNKIPNGDMMMPIFNYFTACILTTSLFISPQPAFVKDQISPPANAVYAKIILPIKAGKNQSFPKIESWILKNLNKRGKTNCRAVTDWIRLPEKGDDTIEAWDAFVDNKTWGCPVSYRAVDRSGNGKIKVELHGFAPASPDIKGQTIDSEIGYRGIAVVDIGSANNSTAYIALFVGPALSVSQANPN